MNRNNIESMVVRAHKDESGQMLAIVSVMLIVLLGIAAFVIDIGRLYFSYRLLQTSTDAAVLAGAQVLPNNGAAAQATLYSGVAGNKNADSNLPNVQMVAGYPKLLCLTTLTSEGMPCVDPAAANALQVEQQVIVPMTFASLIGVKPITLTAVATASMRGSARAPYNVVILVDSTRSMQDSDGGSNCSGSREQCSLEGVQTLLSELSPCGSSQKTCVSAGNGQVQNAVDEVSLLTFPAVTSGAPDYCGGGRLSVQPYPLPAAPNYVPPASPTYQIVNFSSDYRNSDSATTLNTGSDLVLAAGGSSSCAGIQDPGGEGTYYAAAIYTAENMILAEQSNRPNTQNALIILSDGDANAQQSNLASSATKSGVYPSWNDQCQQAVQAANWAKTQGTGGTTVYTVAYGTQSSGCSTDTTNSAPINQLGITPCQAMKEMASSAATFYTDASSSRNACVSDAQPTTNLNQIFTEIAGSFAYARLIPNNTN